MSNLYVAVPVSSGKRVRDGIPAPPAIIAVIFALVLCVSCCCSAIAEMQPSGHNSFYNAETGKGITKLTKLPKYYQEEDSSWQAINVEWEERDDTSYKNIRGVIKVFAHEDGRAQIRARLVDSNGVGHLIVIEQELDRLVFLDTIEYRHIDLITDLTFPEPVMDGRDLRWSFGHWWFQYRKGPGALAAQIAFDSTSIEWILSQWQALPIPSNKRRHVALGNVYKFTVTIDGIEVPDSVFFNDSLTVWKQIAKFGKRAINLSRQVLHVGESGLQINRAFIGQHWTDHGSGCGSDDGDYNNWGFAFQTCDADTADYKASWYDVQYVDATGWFSWFLPDTLLQGYYDGNREEEGWIFRDDGSGENKFISTSFSYTPNSSYPWPEVIIYHHSAVLDARHSDGDVGSRTGSARHRP